MGWLNKRSNYSRMLEKAKERDLKEKEFEELPTMGRTATPEDKKNGEILLLEEENSKYLEPERKKRKEERQAALEDLLVIDGAELECSLCTAPKGILKVNFDTPSTQEKKTATIEEKSSFSLIFTGNCKKSPNCSLPCKAAMTLGDWKKTGMMKVQERPPLLLKSTIPCLYGGVEVKITDSGQVNEPEINPEAAPVPAPKKKIQIKARQNEYTVVLKKDGTLFNALYPNLEFDISEGTPGEFIDIQVVKIDKKLLKNTVGIAGSWDKNNLPKDRVPVKTFSSYTNGDTALKLDASGKASYTMPLDWWRDLARQPLSDFTSMKIYFKVLSFQAASSVKQESLVKSVEISNNLVSLEIDVNLYATNSSGIQIKDFSADFTVKEPNTTEMYTFVQWKKGGRERWDAAKRMTRPTVRDYNQRHISHYPDWTLDRIGLNPRYADGVYSISNGGKTATLKDKPSSDIASATMPWAYTHIDFETRVHLNLDVPDVLTVINLTGGNIKGIIPPPEPLTLKNVFWESRILQIWNATTTSSIVTHPAIYTGP
ncbi:DUF4280 domain-containing protein [Apibacter raozihei]|uniref:DUF4280 domain-containing protein n=1 Tax=Apibacter raozihei TaxID=2500547 RepID=UPI000FE31585|nr:DUF4280 domain-containing protein [Apibacter raozihei]